MIRNWIIPGVVIGVVVFALVFVASARATYGDTRLDAVATSVAGHPVVVSCGSGTAEWAATEHAAGFTFDVDGFTFIGRDNLIHLSPEICGTLEADFRFGVVAVGDEANGRAIKVLLHESSHQAGLADETAAECNALSLIKQYAPSFGYAKTITKVSYVRQGKLYRRVTKVIPNPALALVYSYAVAWKNADTGAC